MQHVCAGCMVTSRLRLVVRRASRKTRSHWCEIYSRAGPCVFLPEIGQQIFFAGMWRSANSVKRVAASRVAYTARPTKDGRSGRQQTGPVTPSSSHTHTQHERFAVHFHKPHLRVQRSGRQVTSGSCTCTARTWCSTLAGTPQGSPSAPAGLDLEGLAYEGRNR